MAGVVCNVLVLVQYKYNDVNKQEISERDGKVCNKI